MLQFKSLLRNNNHAFMSSNMQNGVKRCISTQVIMRSISEDSKKPITHLTFGEMIDHTKFAHHDKNYSKTTLNPYQFLIQSGEFARIEKPSRIAKLIMCLKNLPYGVAETESIESVINDYITTYKELTKSAPIKTVEDVHKYCELCKYLLLKHLLVIPKISYGLLQKAAEPNTTFSVQTCPYLNDFIDQFAQQRIALRVLAGHFIAMYEQIIERDTKDDKKNNNIYKVSGLFEENCNIIKYVENAITDSKADCLRVFGSDNDKEISMPNVKIYDKRKFNTSKFTYIPEHLHHMVFELLKNSMRAVMQFDGASKGDDKDDIDIIIVNNETDGSITIKISDIGGGISRDNLDKIWLYSYTTAYDLNNLTHTEKKDIHRDLLGQVIESAEKQWEFNSDDSCDISHYIKAKTTKQRIVDRSVLGAVKFAPMFGLGYGLPIVKVYANYFGGSCKIQSIDGYGTDAYLDLNNLTGSKIRVI